jgi:drug/metabolite transporter (DMT)-like permease
MITPRRIGLILVATSTLAWSTAGLFIRAADADLATILVWRGLFGTLGMALVLLAFHGPAGFGQFRRLGRAGWAYVLVSVLTLPAYLGSLQLTSIAHVAIIYAMLPFMTAGLGWAWLGERPSGSAIIASSLAFVGALVMVGLGDEGSALGDALGVAMTFGMAVLVVLARRHPGIPAMPAGMLATGCTVLVALPLAGLTLPQGDQLAILAAFGLLHSLFGFTLFLIGSSRIPAVETALLGALDAPIAPLWVWLAFGETPSHATLAGGAIVFAAVFWHIWRSGHAA